MFNNNKFPEYFFKNNQKRVRVAFFKAIRGCTCMCNQLYWISDSGGATFPSVSF